MKKHINADIVLQDTKYKLLINSATNRGIYTLKPDIIAHNDGLEETIIDTKWKKISSTSHRHGVTREDFFQMYAYLTRYTHANTAILLYPHHSGLNKDSSNCLESWYLEEAPHKVLKVYSIDYENEERAIKDLTTILQ